MTQQELGQAKDPDLRASLAAIKRAAQEARRVAVQTGTGIVVVKDQQIVRVTAEELQQGKDS